MNKVILLLVLSIFLFLPQQSLADVNKEGSSVKVPVESMANVIDRLKERINLFFIFNSDDKLSYQEQLLEKRLGELDYVIRTGQGDFIEEVSTRYAAYVGRFSESLLSGQNSSKKEQALETFKTHSKILARMRDNFPANSGFWLLLQHDINTVQIYSEKIKDSK